MNTLQTLGTAGQSPWIDFLKRSFVESGDLAKMIQTDGLKGLTSNPSIFEKAIAESEEYAGAIKAFTAEGAPSITEIYEHLVIADIKAAADVMRPVYDAGHGVDGFVSLECSPYLANDTKATITEGEHLWQAVDRPNLMVKVPATEAGLPAIRALIGQGISVNITLLFSVETYAQVAEAYIAGLEDYRAKGGDVGKVASVASFFISRTDTAVDKALDKLGDALVYPDDHKHVHGNDLRGKIAIANAKLAYAAYGELFNGPRWDALAAAGARTQRLLWASTSTKSKALKDTIYVESLIGRETVDTIPPKTMDAFRDHGIVEPDAIESDLDEARQSLDALADLGIDLEAISRELVVDGVKQFADAFDQLFAAIARQTREAWPDAVGGTRVAPGSDEAKAAFASEMEAWRKDGRIRRLWAVDPTLWTGADEAKWGGWLQVVNDELGDPHPFAFLREHIRGEGFSDVVLLGMGGSSLGPQVLAEVLGDQAGWPKFHMLDSTDPQQIRDLEASFKLDKALFITSSKSGSTLEPNIFTDYFWDKLSAVSGQRTASRHFIAVTDPGSALEQRALEENWAGIYYGVPSIGGRYSVLSKFGLVPATAIGLNVGDLLRQTQLMARSCGADVPPEENPGVQLGVALGVAARSLGRDKVTIIASPSIAPIGAWLEQLLAESTGKQGRGLIPVSGEALAEPDAYGQDRIFAYVELADGFDPAQRAAVAKLAEAGHPVITLAMNAKEDIGQEFFRWEIAVAVAGAIIGIDPFDQPDVEASKLKTKALTQAYEKGETQSEEAPILTEDGMSLCADPANAEKLGQHDTIAAYLNSHFAQIGAGDYAAFLAYIDRTAEATDQLTAIRLAVRDHTKAATCVGFGPRFLHSTGQAYKGGPNSGVFLQVTCDDAQDIAIPGHRYSFGVVKAAQAKGDLEVLVERGRRAIRIHLHDVSTGLPRLVEAIQAALA
jgi:transaldolase/glucose-6-phosphate isomerase